MTAVRRVRRHSNCAILSLMLLAKDRVFSLSGYSYVDTGVTLSGRTSVMFQVKAAKDAHVRLTAKREVYNDNMYEIVLGAGANTYTAVRQVHRITVTTFLTTTEMGISADLPATTVRSSSAAG